MNTINSSSWHIATQLTQTNIKTKTKVHFDSLYIIKYKDDLPINWRHHIDYCFKYLISNAFNSRSKYKCCHVIISPERNKAILTWIIQNIVDLWKSNICAKSCKMCHASAIQNKFWPPPSFKKLPEALIISPELRHLYIYIQTDRHWRHKLKSRSTVHNSAKETGHK